MDKLTAAVEDEYRQQTGKQLSVFKDTILLPGERWEERILTAVKASRCLLAVMSPPYFQSDYCRKEWEHFHAEEEKRGIRDLIIPVYYTEHEPFENPGQRQDEWLKDLAARQCEDFRQYRHEGAGAFRSKRELKEKVERLVKGLRKALEGGRVLPPLNPKVAAQLRSLALLGVLALRLDRFKDGGWGLSLGNWFTRSSDRSFYRTGLPEVNLLVLRALRTFLEKEQLLKEVDSSLPHQDASNTAKVTVQDRRSLFANLLALLQNEIRTTMGGRLNEHKQHFNHRPFVQRWGPPAKLDQPTDDFWILFYDLILRIHRDSEALGVLTGTLTKAASQASGGKAGALRENYLGEHLNEAEKCAEQWLRDNWLFDMLAKDGLFKDPPKPGGEEDVTWTLCLLNYRMLASVQRSAEKVISRSALRTLRDRCKKIEENLRRLCNPRDSLQLGRAILYYSLYLMVLLDLQYHTEGVPSEHLEKIENDWRDLLMRSNVGEAMLQSNCVLWALLLLLAKWWSASIHSLPRLMPLSVNRGTFEIIRPRSLRAYASRVREWGIRIFCSSEVKRQKRCATSFDPYVFAASHASPVKSGEARKSLVKNNIRFCTGNSSSSLKK